MIQHIPIAIGEGVRFHHFGRIGADFFLAEILHLVSIEANGQAVAPDDVFGGQSWLQERTAAYQKFFVAIFLGQFHNIGDVFERQLDFWEIEELQVCSYNS